MKIKVVFRGIIKIIWPWLYNFLKKRGTGGTDSASYCYSVWLRHIILLHENGMYNLPKSIVEIGPGDSLGIGLNALITGANKFFAFDIIKHANTERNLKIFDELVNLYKSQIEIPNDTPFENVKPKLKNYKFPKHILNDTYLKEMLNDIRLNQIREAIKNTESGEFVIKYVLPNNKDIEIEKDSIDLIYSQAVMEHIIDISTIYNNSYYWLRFGGYMSHEIDYSAHETHKKWFGHWTYPKWLWNIILEGRLYSINRYPHSFHIRTMLKSNFKIVFHLPFTNIKAKSIQKNIFYNYEFNDEDLKTSGGYIIAQKV